MGMRRRGLGLGLGQGQGWEQERGDGGEKEKKKQGGGGGRKKEEEAGGGDDGDDDGDEEGGGCECEQLAQTQRRRLAQSPRLRSVTHPRQHSTPSHPTARPVTAPAVTPERGTRFCGNRPVWGESKQGLRSHARPSLGLRHGACPCPCPLQAQATSSPPLSSNSLSSPPTPATLPATPSQRARPHVNSRLCLPRVPRPCIPLYSFCTYTRATALVTLANIFLA